MTLALGIGANTAVFTLVDGVLLSPLPFEDSGDLVALEHQGRDGQDQLPMSQGLYALYSDQASSLESIGMYASATITLVADGEPERIRGQVVTPSFFEVMDADFNSLATVAVNGGEPAFRVMTATIDDDLYVVYDEMDKDAYVGVSEAKLERYRLTAP